MVVTHRVGAKGQVVIPKDLRDALGIQPGDEVTFWRHGDHVAVRPADSGRALRGRFRGSGLAEMLEHDRRAESERNPELLVDHAAWRWRDLRS